MSSVLSARTKLPMAMHIKFRHIERCSWSDSLGFDVMEPVIEQTLLGIEADTSWRVELKTSDAWL